MIPPALVTSKGKKVSLVQIAYELSLRSVGKGRGREEKKGEGGRRVSRNGISMAVP